jgi:glycosyltransferase involved in cell wall biosynthesis
MSTPVVTVIVPGRDVASFAEAALASLRAQTLADWTAILVDDGSTDATGELFARAAASDPRFRVLRHDPARGLGAARNAALDLVETPLVAFLDADDEFAPSALERLTGTLLETGSDFVAGAYVRLRPDGDGYVAGTVQPWVSAATAPERRGTTLAGHPEASGNIVAWSKLSRVEFWRRAGLRFPEGRLYEDQIVAQLMYTRARAFDVIPDVVVRWRERADGSSITQHKDAVPVLVDYLAAMTGGLAVLDAAGAESAALARVRLILDMDVPPLVRIAADHADPAYRRAVGAFVRTLADRAEQDRVALDPSATDLLAAARLW